MFTVQELHSNVSDIKVNEKNAIEETSLTARCRKCKTLCKINTWAQFKKV